MTSEGITARNSEMLEPSFPRHGTFLQGLREAMHQERQQDQNQVPLSSSPWSARSPRIRAGVRGGGGARSSGSLEKHTSLCEEIDDEEVGIGSHDDGGPESHALPSAGQRPGELVVRLSLSPKGRSRSMSQLKQEGRKEQAPPPPAVLIQALNGQSGTKPSHPGVWMINPHSKDIAPGSCVCLPEGPGSQEHVLLPNLFLSDPQPWCRGGCDGRFFDYQ